jgi:predicted DsbA family dithiol-disulfide isomerase
VEQAADDACQAQESRTAHIDVYADIWCPYTHVGLRRITARRHELGRDDVKLFVRAWPLELVNGRPQDPSTTLGHASDLRAQVAPELFARFDAVHFPASTLAALALAASAYRRSAEVGERVSLDLRDLLFEEGEDVSSPSILEALARRHSLTVEPVDHKAVIRSWHQGQALGVQGSPHFFCGGRDAFCPALDLSLDPGGVMHIKESGERLFAFIDGCFTDEEPATTKTDRR